MRILLLGWNRFSKVITRSRRWYYKKKDWYPELFRRELARQADDIIFFGYGYARYNPNYKTVGHLVEKYKPDVVFVHNGGHEFTETIGYIPDHVLKVHMNQDYWKTNCENYDYYHNTWDFDIIFMPVTKEVKLLQSRGFKARLSMFSADLTKQEDLHLSRDIDVMASFATPGRVYGPQRKEIHVWLKTVTDLNVYMGKAGWEAHVEKLNQSKIVLNNVARWAFMNQRFFEVPACNSLLLTDYAEDQPLVGLEDGKHLVIYENLKDMKEKIYYYLEHEEERKSIARQGYEYVRKNHSLKQRVSEFLVDLQEELDNHRK